MFIHFFLDLLIQALLLANFGLLVSFYLDRQNTPAAKLFALVVRKTAFLFSAFLVLGFLVAAWQFPEIVRPLKTPVDLMTSIVAVPAEVSLSLSITLIVVLFVPIVVYLRKVIAGQERDRAEVRKAKAQHTKDVGQLKKLRKDRRDAEALEKVYAYVMAHNEVPQHVKDEVYRLAARR